MLSVIDKRDDKIKKLELDVRELQFQSDCSLQYSMRPNLKITGLEYEKGENLEEKVKTLCKDMDSEIESEEISVTHRVGDETPDKHGNITPPAVIVKFTRRKTRNRVFEARKKLHENRKYTNVYISDHVTPLRSRILYELRNRDNKALFKYVWSREGRIYARKPNEVNQRNASNMPKLHVFQRPEDLKDYGWSDAEILNIIQNKRQRRPE